ncbi:MAG: rhodanese-like domain-containing protein [bacterium]
MSGRIQLRALAAIAIALALLAAVAGSPTRGASHSASFASLDATALAKEIEREDDHVTARELAEWIRADKAGLHVIDVRSDSAFAAYHIPSAESMSLASVASHAPVPGETLVLYSEGGAHAAQAWVLLRARGHEHVYFLRGGLLDWMDDVMSPIVAGDSAAHVSALSRYFGGVPRAASGPQSATPALPVAPVSSLERMRRRGC